MRANPNAERERLRANKEKANVLPIARNARNGKEHARKTQQQKKRAEFS